MSKRMPGPGFWLSLRLGRQFQENYLHPLEIIFKKYGDFVQLPAFGPPVLFVFHPQAVEHVLKSNAKNYSKADDLQELQPVLGMGLLTNDGEVWREHRRAIAPEFQHKKIEGFFPIIQRHLHEMLEHWRTQDQPFNTASSITRTTYSIASECFFGAHLPETSEAVYRAVDKTSEFAVRRMGNPFALPYWLPLPSHERTRAYVRELNEIVYGIIDRRMAQNSEQVDVLSRLTKSGTFTREQIRDEVMTLLLAGHETTSNAVSWTLYLLGLHPGIQENARDEVLSVMSAEMPTLEECKRLPLTKMIFEESMRIFPPAAIMGRKALTADEVNGFSIPAGSNVNVSQWVTHRHPEFWTEPETFWPERFAQAPHPFSYFPFGAGPRECIGKNMAMVEGIAILAAILREFRLELAGGPVTPKALITVRPDPGVTLRLHPVSKRAVPKANSVQNEKMS